jgi:hypothetical protein
MDRLLYPPVVLAAIVSLSGCYEAELDALQSGVYVCDDSEDCALGLQCIDGLCIGSEDEVGPELQIDSPAQLEVFPVGSGGRLPMRISGVALELTSDPEGGFGQGYVEIQVDGALIDTVHAGSLEQGIDVDSVPFPLDAGLHHLRVIARHPDGTAYTNPAASEYIGFWVDDGAEHVGILSPAPSTRVPLGQGEELTLDIVSLNYTFVNPGFTAPDDPDPRIGYVNLFIDADVPNCLPACNFDYQTSITPAGLSRVNRITAEQGVLLPDGVGAARLQIVAETPANEPYIRGGNDGGVVFYQVPIQSVVTGNE